MILALVGAGAAIVAAVLGVLIAQWLQRSRPVVLVDTLHVSPTPVPSGSMAQVNHELMHKVRSSPYQLGPTEQPFGKVTQEEYISYLCSVRRDINEHVELELPYLSEIVENLRHHLSMGDLNIFESLWAQEQVKFWGILESMALRKDLKVDELKTEINKLHVAIKNTKSVYDLKPGPEGRQIVDLPGVLPITLPPGGWSWQKNISEMLADCTAKALAYENRDFLQTLVNYLSSQSTALLEPLKNLRDVVDAELRQYDRIYVAGLIGNTGNSPFSVLAYGKFIINAKGYYLESDEDSDADSPEETKIRENIPVRLVIGGAEGPLSIPVGCTVRFNAVTSRMI
jgi:hypothetical protein